MRIYLVIFLELITSLLLVCAQDFEEVYKAVASDRAIEDFFGTSVSISGNYAIVGAPDEDEDVGGGNTLDVAGSAYIFERDGKGDWNEVQKIVASDRSLGDRFGKSVSIWGSYVIVGAFCEDQDAEGMNALNNAGSAYIFERDGNGNWNEVQKIVASDRAELDWFGFSVSISGNYAIVGAYMENEDAEGGNTLDNAGSAYIFGRDGSGNWNEIQKIVASDRAVEDYFGISVSISGNFAIVGGTHEDEDVGGGNTLNEAGSAYIFEREDDGDWNEVQKIVASDRAAGDYFSTSVSVSGNYALVGAQFEDEDIGGGNYLNNAGSAYIFERDGSGNWNEVQKIVAPDRATLDYFGVSVSISGNYILVGAYTEDEDAGGENTLDYSGSAYIFERDGGGNWDEVQKIVTSDRAVEDFFGCSVSISGDYALVGAYYEDDDASGGNTLNEAGSVYIFESCVPDTTSDAQNVIENAGFEECIFDPWTLYYSGDLGAIVTYQLIDGTCIVTPSHLAPSPEVWHIQLVQPFSATQLNKLETGEIYNLQFDAWSEAENRLCHIYFGMNEDPWSMLLDEYFLLNMTQETYSFDFILSAVYSSMKLAFDIGSEITWVGFDNVKLMKKSELRIEENEINNTKIWPNPASDYIEIQTIPGSVVTLYNTMGVLIQQMDTTDGYLRLKMVSIPKGMYFIEVYNSGQIELHQVILK